MLRLSASGRYSKCGALPCAPDGQEAHAGILWGMAKRTEVRIAGAACIGYDTWHPPSFSDTFEDSVSAMQKAILVTGGAGFIGSNFILHWMEREQSAVANLDLLTYAGNLHNLASVARDPRYSFVRGDIKDGKVLRQLFQQIQPAAVVHFAAESHVDRSIHDPRAFIETNIWGTYQLLNAALEYHGSLPAAERDGFRFLHVSTDEVYGSLGPNDPAFRETTAYSPTSPYSASKAASDHLVRAYYHTYGLPVLITNCSNNYGPRQFPEKLIPLMIINALSHKPLPVYGDGLNVRDWLYVQDHSEAIRCVLAKGVPGNTYNVGGRSEKTNLDIVRTICSVLNELRPGNGDYASLITFVKDRPGHDRRYAIDATKISTDLGWSPRESFTSGIRKTVNWYIENEEWIRNVTTGAYQQWISTNYAGRG